MRRAIFSDSTAFFPIEELDFSVCRESSERPDVWLFKLR